MGYLLKNLSIIDVELEKVFQGSIEVQGERITQIFHSEVNKKYDETYDMQGKFAIPGLIDMHCHIKEGFAPHFTAAGVTTIRNTAGNVMELDNLIQAENNAPTPRVYSADRMIDGAPGLWGPTGIANFVTEQPEEARKEVRRQVRNGAQFIKVYGLLSKPVMKAVVEEAQKYNLEVSCDLIHSTVNALEAAELGVTWFEHASGIIQAMYPGWHMQAEGFDIDWEKVNQGKIDEVCEKLLAYNVKLCPTLTVFDQIQLLPNSWDPKNVITQSCGLLSQSCGLTEHWESLAENEDTFKDNLGFLNNVTKRIAKTYHDLGGTVVTGTDCPAGVWTFPGMGLHRELELFVEIGLSEMEALQAATNKAAKSINLEQVGMIKKDHIADLVILDKNPLDNIENTKEIFSIIKGGKVYEQQAILKTVPSKEYLEKTFKEFEKKFNISS
ncbi:amidohydrolase family protein [Salipaludibacillus sp. CUR1]|uniref:amidohydrolase family protein n=1 Tax=Salipaludibacillus sp. CUR1 TaxID=2820003 RepID=UPI001E2F4A8B|nr:amidohydrolase family protein [Salipaludibacillus sp. CUR1]MCE7792821.1 amidohydrolase family protein [Salipaludibacillus sp. CUR1]